METDLELEQANQRLLEQREELKATDNLTPLNESIEDIIARAREKAESSNVIQFSGDHDEAPRETWDGIYSGVPKLYADCTFETFTGNDRLVAAIKALVKQDSHIVLRGKTGCGKTHLAVSILKEAKEGWFVTAPDLLLTIRSSFNGGDASEDEIIRQYAGYPLLIIDDLGAEKTSEYSITTLYIIIDRRIRDMKKTVITTNLTQEQIEETLGARIASRMAGMENIRINMPDYRKKR